MPPQLIFWEGLRPSVPPLVAGCFFARKCAGEAAAVQITDPVKCKEAWANCVKGGDVWTEGWGDEVSFWRGAGAGAGADPVVIWNTFHQALGGSVGVILGSPSAANALAASKSPWGVLLLPQATPFTQFGDWTFDSAFQWIGYNLSVGFISGKFPALGL
jgi:hypothetical protein